MAYVEVNNTTGEGATLNVTIDTGTSANRKAICLYAHQMSSGTTAGTCTRDPDGTPESCTLERSTNILRPGDAFYVMDSFFLDLSETGSQTFRFNTASGGPSRSVAAVIVWDGLASGAADVIESYIELSDPVTAVVSDSITTLVDNALIVQFAMRYIDSGTGANRWTPDNGQDERVDANYAFLGATAGTLVKATAGAQTIGSTETDAAEVNGQHLLSYAPAVVGPTIDTQPEADVVLINGDPTRASASYTVAATTSGGSLSYDWELEETVGGGTYVNVPNGAGLTWSGADTATLTAVVTAKTQTGKRVRCNVTDENGTTTSDAVLLTIYTGPVLSKSSGTTNGSGVDTLTITSDYPNGVGEFTVTTATSRGITKTVSQVFTA